MIQQKYVLWTASVQSKLSSSTRCYSSIPGSTSTSPLFFLTSSAADTHQASLRLQIKIDAANEVHTQPQANLGDKYCTWKEFLKEIKMQVVCKNRFSNYY